MSENTPKVNVINDISSEIPAPATTPEVSVVAEVEGYTLPDEYVADDTGFTYDLESLSDAESDRNAASHVPMTGDAYQANWERLFDAMATTDWLGTFDALVGVGCRPVPIKRERPPKNDPDRVVKIKVPFQVGWGILSLNERRTELEQQVTQHKRRAAMVAAGKMSSDYRIMFGIGVQADNYIVLDLDPPGKDRGLLPPLVEAAAAMMCGGETEFPKTFDYGTAAGRHLWFKTTPAILAAWQSGGKLQIHLGDAGMVEVFTGHRGENSQMQVAFPPSEGKVFTRDGAVPPADCPPGVEAAILATIAAQGEATPSKGGKGGKTATRAAGGGGTGTAGGGDPAQYAADLAWTRNTYLSGALNDRLEDYKAWLDVGMAMHHSFGDIDGTELFIEYSRPATTFDVDECIAKIRSMKPKGRPLGFGSLRKWAADKGIAGPPTVKRQSNLDDINAGRGNLEDYGSDVGEDDELLPGDGAYADDDRPMIENSERNFHESLMLVVKILTTCRTLYVRHGRIVEIEKETMGDNAGKITIVDAPAERLASLFSPKAVLFTYKKTKKGKLYESPQKPVAFMKLVIPQRRFPGMRELVGVQESPYFFGNRFINTVGYDEESGLLLDGEPMESAPVVGDVTEPQALEAARFIEETLGVLGYESDARQGIWNIASITMSIQTRWLHKIRPANLVTAPEQGSGKSEATFLAVKAGTGRQSVAGIPLVGNKNFEGDLFSHAGGSMSYLLFDNLSDGYSFGNPTLDRVITSGTIAGRPYHQNAAIEERSANFVIVANGNNIHSGDDMSRRCLMTRLVKLSYDGTGESYEERFSRRRKDFARSCAIVVAWHIQNGCPAPTGTVIPPENFGDWGRYVRDAVWYASKLTGEPVDVMQGRREMARQDTKKDEARELLYALLAYWGKDGESTAPGWRESFTAAEIAVELLSLDATSRANPIAAIVGRNASAKQVGMAIGRYKDHSITVGQYKYTLIRDTRDNAVRQWTFKYDYAE